MLFYFYVTIATTIIPSDRLDHSAEKSITNSKSQVISHLTAIESTTNMIPPVKSERYDALNCCRDNGVHEDCLGFCRLSKERTIPATSFGSCTKYLDTMKICRKKVGL